MGSALWYLFTRSTVEAVRVTAISSLSRLTRLDPAVFLSVIDTCGPAAVLEGIGGAGSRVQQHLLTAVASAVLASHIHKHRITQSRVRALSEARVQDITRSSNVNFKAVQATYYQEAMSSYIA
ncbi:hypothetical protein GOODEAATRI_004775 [Goodea atripinnis]